MKIYHNSQIEYFGQPISNFSNDEIKNEPMFFNCDLEFAYKNGGKITREFIDRLPSEVKNFPCVFDSRVHMLMKNWWPCIPGFHSDDVDRNTINGQPNYLTPRYRSNHIMALVNGDICSTEFALGECNLELPSDDKIIYKEWHKDVNKLIEEGKLISHKVQSNRLIKFDDRSFHQGTSAIDNGWRWFGRLSYNTIRTNNITNEIRRQVQVYLEHPMEGW